jgi:hypothetical protein
MELFQQFLTEREYIKNTSPATAARYEDVAKHFPGLDTHSAGQGAGLILLLSRLANP